MGIEFKTFDKEDGSEGSREGILKAKMIRMKSVGRSGTSNVEIDDARGRLEQAVELHQMEPPRGAAVFHLQIFCY